MQSDLAGVSKRIVSGSSHWRQRATWQLAYPGPTLAALRGTTYTHNQR